MAVPEIRRLYFTMKEICDVTGVTAHTLKSWERKYPQLRPAKAKSGKRLYRPSDIRTVEQIRDWAAAGMEDLEIVRRLESRPEENDEIRADEALAGRGPTAFPLPAADGALVSRLIEIRKGLEELREMLR
jgi:DNA-binding transcriptional MerR regulator